MIRFWAACFASQPWYIRIQSAIFGLCSSVALLPKFLPLELFVLLMPHDFRIKRLLNLSLVFACRRKFVHKPKLSFGWAYLMRYCLGCVWDFSLYLSFPRCRDYVPVICMRLRAFTIAKRCLVCGWSWCWPGWRRLRSLVIMLFDVFCGCSVGWRFGFGVGRWLEVAFCFRFALMMLFLINFCLF